MVRRSVTVSRVTDAADSAIRQISGALTLELLTKKPHSSNQEDTFHVTVNPGPDAGHRN
jgi:hypothetical protein